MPEGAPLQAQPAGDRSAVRDPGPSRARRTISSQELLAGAGVVQIAHGDELYVLRQTRNGRLILTK